MRQPTLFDEEPIAAAPIARASDPVTSHKAAAKTESGKTRRQMQCLEVLRDSGRAMNANELAQACVDRFCPEVRSNPDLYSHEKSNFRKRADEIKRDSGLTVRLGTERDGGELFEARKPR
jgi:hypothetical protein